VSDREFRSLLLKMISDLKEDSNKQINVIRKSIQDLDKKVRNMENMKKSRNVRSKKHQ
jgi:hypothetical protein